MPVFNIVTEIKEQELDNAVNTMFTEVGTRHDYHGLHSEVQFRRKRILSTLWPQEARNFRL